MEPVVSIIVPTRDSVLRISKLLDSIEAEDYGFVEVLINDDPRSLDDMERAADAWRDNGLRIAVLHTNHSRAVGRLSAAREAAGRILVHLDSDMNLTPGLLREVVERVDSGTDALVIPEVSYGEGFWARCKVLEKACVQGDAEVECLRALTAELYFAVGGHDPALVWSEDKDLDLRVRERTSKIGRTMSVLEHDEGQITYFASVRKKATYALTAQSFAAKHPGSFRGQADPRRILQLFVRAARSGEDPRVVAGLVALKSGEYAAVGASLVRSRIASERASQLAKRAG